MFLVESPHLPDGTLSGARSATTSRFVQIRFLVWLPNGQGAVLPKLDYRFPTATHATLESLLVACVKRWLLGV